MSRHAATRIVHRPEFARETDANCEVVVCQLAGICLQFKTRSSTCRGTAQRVLWRVTKSDLQAHSSLLVFVPFDRPYMISYQSSIVTVLYRFRDIIAYFSKVQEVTWPRPRPRGGRLSSREYYLNTAYMCTTVDDCIASIVSEIWLGPQNLMGHMTWPRPFQGQFIVRRLGLNVISLATKFEVSSFAHYEDMKGNAKCRNWGGFGRLEQSCP